MEFLLLFTIIFVLCAIGFALFSIRILIKKNGRFSSQHVGQSKAMRKRGVYCAQTQDKMERKDVE